MISPVSSRDAVPEPERDEATLTRKREAVQNDAKFRIELDQARARTCSTRISALYLQSSSNQPLARLNSQRRSRIPMLFPWDVRPAPKSPDTQLQSRQFPQLLHFDLPSLREAIVARPMTEAKDASATTPENQMLRDSAGVRTRRRANDSRNGGSAVEETKSAAPAETGAPEADANAIASMSTGSTATAQAPSPPVKMYQLPDGAGALDALVDFAAMHRSQGGGFEFHAQFGRGAGSFSGIRIRLASTAKGGIRLSLFDSGNPVGSESIATTLRKHLRDCGFDIVDAP